MTSEVFTEPFILDPEPAYLLRIVDRDTDLGKRKKNLQI